MNEYDLKVLTILFSTNKTLHEAYTSNVYRLDAIPELNNDYKVQLKNTSITPIESPLQKIRNEMYNILIFSKEYVNFLANIKSINIYDAAEIIVEIGDISRFKNRKHFISYCGLSPVDKKGDKVYKVRKYKKGKHVANKKYDNVDYCENLKVCLTRCAQKIINNDDEYKSIYNERVQYYHRKHPMYSKKRIHLMALKKVTIKFANEVYSTFKNIKENEEYEEMQMIIN